MPTNPHLTQISCMNNKHLLIIEDCSMEIELLKMLLERAEIPLTVQFKLCGIQGLAYLEELAPEEFPDVIISDINLTMMTGVEFFKSVSDRFPNSCEKTRFFLTSSIEPRESHKKQFTKAHINGFIEKPLMETSLLALLN